jgi:hypothetical protein
MGLAPFQGKKWVRFQPALSRKVGQISTGVDNIILMCHILYHRNAELTLFRRQCRHPPRIDIIGNNLATFMNKAPSDCEPDA